MISPMTATELLHELAAKGIRLMAHGEQIAADAPRAVMTDTLRQAIRQHKAALLTLLVQTPREPPGLEAEYRHCRDFLELWEERAAIMEYDGGLPRDDAEWQAYLCVKGEWHAPQ